MVWQYFLVFLGAFLFDVFPLPLPPAFTVMVFMQIKFDLNIWLVIVAGVAGSIAGRYLLTLYVSRLSGKLFDAAKNEDVKYLGKKIKERGMRGQLFILIYSLMPLPTTPLFIAGGMAKLKPAYLLIPFIIGKFTSDTVAVILGMYATRHTGELFTGLVSWQSIAGFVAGLLLVFLFVFIDWTSLLKNKKFKLRFNVMKRI